MSEAIHAHDEGGGGSAPAGTASLQTAVGFATEFKENVQIFEGAFNFLLMLYADLQLQLVTVQPTESAELRDIDPETGLPIMREDVVSKFDVLNGNIEKLREDLSKGKEQLARTNAKVDSGLPKVFSMIGELREQINNLNIFTLLQPKSADSPELDRPPGWEGGR